MKIIGYGIASSQGFEKLPSFIEQRKRMKYLHTINIQPIPKVLVEGLPGTTKAEWKTESEYKKLKKEEELHGNN